MKNLLAVLFTTFLFLPVQVCAAGATQANVTVSSVANGRVLFSSINPNGGALVEIDATNTTGAVWFVRTANDCTTVGAPSGTRLSRDSSKDPAGWYFDPKAENWTGQVCVILDTGSSSVTLRTESW